MANSVRTRVLQGLSANAYQTLGVVVVQLAGVPILLHAWGAGLYGEWLVLFAIPAYLSLTNLGYSLSVANDMTMLVARGDRQRALTAFQSLTGLVTLTGAGAFVIVAVAVLTLPVPGWLHLSALPSHSARWVLLLLAGEVLAHLFGGISSAGYRANGDYGLAVALEATTILGQYAALWTAALTGLGVVWAAAVFLGIRAFGSVASLAYLVRRHPWLRLGFRGARFTYVRQVFAPSLANILLPLSNALKNQGLVLVVTAFFGPLAVVTFSVLRTLSRLPMRLVMIIGNAIEPEVAGAEGSGDRSVQRRLYLRGLTAGFWLSVAGGVALYVLGPAILRVWTQGRVAMDRGLFLWLLASSVAAGLWQVPMSVTQSLNRHLPASLAHIAAALLTLMGAWVLLDITETLPGAGAAMFVGDALLACFVMYFAARLLDIRPKGSTVWRDGSTGRLPTVGSGLDRGAHVNDR